MKTPDENTPATMEELNAFFNSKEWKETKALMDEAEKRMEVMNLVPHNKGGERYIRERYPIAALYARSDLQNIAIDEFDTTLTETEIQAVSDEFFCDYPEEMSLSIAAAVERVVKRRQPY
ncbi:hypothetical protein KGQ25_01810 [Patescibacteria group bacterium]|nr:hypothetical protein [Patescibacteria group bacterium]